MIHASRLFGFVLMFLVPAGGYTVLPHRDGQSTPARRKKLPGRMEVALYDLGGENAAHHDTEARNLGGVGVESGGWELSD